MMRGIVGRFTSHIAAALPPIHDVTPSALAYSVGPTATTCPGRSGRPDDESGGGRLGRLGAC